MKKPLKWIIQRNKGLGVYTFILVFTNALFSLCSVAFAFAIKSVIDCGVAGDTDGLTLSAVFICSIVVAQLLLRVANNGLSEFIKGKSEIAIKTYLFAKLFKKEYNELTKFHSGEIITRLSSDVRIVSEGYAGLLPLVVASAVRLIAGVVSLIVLVPVFSLAFIIAGILVFSVITFVKKKIKNLHKKVQESEGKIRAFMQESTENVLAVKVFSIDDKITEKGVKLQKDNFRYKMQKAMFGVTGHATYNLIYSAGYVFALVYGSVMILNGQLTYGALSAVLQLVNNVQVPFASLSNVFPQYYSMLASAERLMEFETLKDEIRGEPINKLNVYGDLTQIVFEDVGFNYGREKVLETANLAINKNDFVDISGISGIGKSTLIKLLLGVYRPLEGKIYLKCKDKNIPIGENTRSLFSYVPQGNMLFSGTIKDNLLIVKENATEEEISRALEISCMKDFFYSLPDKLDTVVGERGLGLSEGQIQRIAIARAVLCDAPVILLDEATSALDEETEEKVLKNLKGINGITLIIISHKQAAKKICNRYIEIKNRRIIEK